MTTSEHLQKIKAKCQEMISAFPSCESVAGWQSTIAAIDDWLGLYIYTEGFADGAPDASPHDKLCNEVASMARRSLNHIIAAWPEEMF